MYSIGDTFKVIEVSNSPNDWVTVLLNAKVELVWLEDVSRITGKNWIALDGCVGIVKDPYNITSQELDNIKGGLVLEKFDKPIWDFTEQYDHFSIEDAEFWGEQNWEESGWL